MSRQHSPWLPHSLQHFLPAELQLSADTWAFTSRVFACLGDSITDGTLHLEVLSPSLLSLVAMATTSLRT
ncbi:hypothetical protein XELAEV_18012558mg [Xenopus laevis]|uniref:Uncharacterized protein n=1 Tax=Xenopus laevis TaxID=8355 RepID=A0A974DP87_XENLA|nr:hypothetical protein XELAEV_18012558mg [Xenopus laevis]